MSILNKITYSNGCMNAEAISAPAKLKLRENTFEGIKSLQAKKYNQSNMFAIPNAYMAMDDVNNSGSSSEISVVDRNISDLPVEVSATPKKLRVKEDQMDFNTGNEFSSNGTTFQNNGYDVSGVVGVQTPDVVMPSMATNDTKDRVLSTAIEFVEHAENQDSFAKLRQATAEYGEVNEGLKAAIARVESEKEALASLEKTYSEICEDLAKEQHGVEEVMETIGVHERDIAEIQEKSEELSRKIEEKLLQIEELKRQRAEEKRRKEEEEKNYKAKEDECQKKIDEGKMQIEELRERRKTLDETERATLETREQAQEVLKERQNIYNAISLPALIKEDANNAVVTPVANANDNVVSFPTPAVLDAEIEMDGPSMVRSMGKAA